MRIRGRHYRTGEIMVITVQNACITTIESGDDAPVDAEAGWVAPAFFDLQINGCNGHSFNATDLTVADVREVVDVCSLHGIGGFLPTVITGSYEAIRHGFLTLEQARQSDTTIRDCIPGYHLEGPYISREDGPRGAHPIEHVRPPDWDEFCRWQEAASGSIRLVTLAPELPGAIRFIERLVASGAVVAIGHTAATPQAIRDAIAAGARLSTHIGNGSHAVLPRHENYLWEQLASDALWASIIPDGQHLPAVMLKCITRIKTPDRLIITCDASSLAGLPPRRYSHWGNNLEVLENGKIVVSGTLFLAGSGVFTDRCIAPMMAAAGLSLSQAIDMASRNPRQLLNLPIPQLEVGSHGALMLFDWQPGQDLVVKQMVF